MEWAMEIAMAWLPKVQIAVGKLMEHLSLTQAASHSSQMHPPALSLHMGIVLLALVPLLDFHNPPKPALACVVVWEQSNSLDWWDLWQLYRRRRDNGTDLHRVSSQGQGFSSDLPDYNNQLAYRSQVWLVMMFSEQCTLCSTGQTSSSMYGILSDVAAVQFYFVFECMWEEHTMRWACGCVMIAKDMMVRSSRMSEDGDNQRQLQSRLGDANIKALSFISFAAPNSVMCQIFCHSVLPWSTASLMDGWFLSCWISGSSTDQWEEDTGATGCRTATGNVLSISFCDQLLHV